VLLLINVLSYCLRCIPKETPGADWRVLLEIVREDPSREMYEVSTSIMAWEGGRQGEGQGKGDERDERQHHGMGGDRGRGRGRERGMYEVSTCMMARELGVVGMVGVSCCLLQAPAGVGWRVVVPQEGGGEEAGHTFCLTSAWRHSLLRTHTMDLVMRHLALSDWGINLLRTTASCLHVIM